MNLAHVGQKLAMTLPRWSRARFNITEWALLLMLSDGEPMLLTTAMRQTGWSVATLIGVERRLVRGGFCIDHNKTLPRVVQLSPKGIRVVRRVPE